MILSDSYKECFDFIKYS